MKTWRDRLRRLYPATTPRRPIHSIRARGGICDASSTPVGNKCMSSAKPMTEIRVKKIRGWNQNRECGAYARRRMTTHGSIHARIPATPQMRRNRGFDLAGGGPCAEVVFGPGDLEAKLFVEATDREFGFGVGGWHQAIIGNRVALAGSHGDETVVFADH